MLPRDRPFEEQSRRAIKRAIEITQKLTAGRARQRLERKIDEALLAEIEPLIEWRNFLAHRYLRVRLASDGVEVAATPAMFAELIDLTLRFQEATKKVTALHQPLLNQRPQATMPEPVVEAFTELSRRIVLHEPAPLPPRSTQSTQTGGD